MRLKKRIINFAVHCIVICMIFPQLLPLFAYAESSETTLRVGDASVQLSIHPYVNDLGIMIDAAQITESFGMAYQLDEENKAFTIFDEKHGEIVLMHNATKFSSGGRLYNCAPYFYIENTIPMIELGFFCDMFDSSYQYDEKTNTISVSRGEISGKTPKIKVGDRLVPVMNEPFVGEYGLAAGAEDIARAFGIEYTYDGEAETATFYDDKHGEVVLTNGATSFKSGESEFDCLPYFYLSGSVPVITVDFFCRMYGAEYEYDKAAKTLELFTPEQLAAKNAVSLLAAPAISGEISYAPGAESSAIPVKIVLQPFKFDMYNNIIGGSKAELGTVTFGAGETVKNYSYEISLPDGYPYYYLYYEAPGVGKYGYYSEDGQTIQATAAPELEHITTAKRFSAAESAQANLTVDYNRVYGNIKVGENPPAGGLDVKIILQQGDIRSVRYEPPYLVPGEAVTLGEVHFEPSETEKEYSYITTGYYSEQYPYYSLFYEAPAISKYGYYNNVQGTTVLDSAVDYSDAQWYTAATTAVVPLHSKTQMNLDITASVNLSGSVSVDESAVLPDAGMEVTLYLQTVKSRQYIYGGAAVSTTYTPDKMYELGTVSLSDPDSAAAFAFDTYKWTTSQYYYLLYLIKNPQDSVAAAGFLNERSYITGVEALENYHTASYQTSQMRLSSTEAEEVSIKLPAFVYQPCGADSYWTLDTETKTLYIKGTGEVTDNSWSLLSEYIAAVEVSPGITSLSANMPVNTERLRLPDTITDIGDGAFSKCSKLTEVVYSGTREGWSEVAVGENNSSLTSASISFEGSDSVYVIYHGNGGSGSPESTEAAKNGEATLSSAVPVREGFEFLGWATTADATAAEYLPGGTIFAGTKDIALYAVWSKGGDVNSEGTCGENITWALYNDGTLVISGTGVMSDDSYDLSPWFSLHDDIKSVIIKDGITSVGDYAFYGCSSLTDVCYTGTEESWNEISIGLYNTALTSTNIYFGLNSIVRIIYDNNKGTGGPEDSVVAANSQGVSLSETVPAREGYSFLGWATAADAAAVEYLPGDEISVGEDNIILYAVWQISGTFGENLTWELYGNGTLVISGTGAMPDYSYGSPPWDYMSSDIISVIIKDGVTNISTRAFFDCYSLTNITIADSVTSIGEYAFGYCWNLTSVTIPDGVTAIDDYAFIYCSGLTSVTISDSVTTIGYGAFYGCSSLKNVYYTGTQQEWDSIAIGVGNDRLTEAAIKLAPDISVKSSDCCYKDGAITAQLEFEHVNKDAVLYLAIYDSDRRLVKVASADIKKGAASAKITLPAYADYVGYSFKIMIWDAKTLAPEAGAIDGVVSA